MPKTTNDHFKLFVAESKYWLAYYGFTEWHVEFAHTDKDSPQEGVHAWFVASNEDKNAYITLTRTWIDTKPTEELIKTFAHHEVAELLLHRLDTLCRQRYGVTEEQIDESRHEVIQRLINNHTYKSYPVLLDDSQKILPNPLINA
jgi:hypothetical protein